MEFKSYRFDFSSPYQSAKPYSCKKGSCGIAENKFVQFDREVLEESSNRPIKFLRYSRVHIFVNVLNKSPIANKVCFTCYILKGRFVEKNIKMRFYSVIFRVNKSHNERGTLELIHLLYTSNFKSNFKICVLILVPLENYRKLSKNQPTHSRLSA